MNGKSVYLYRHHLSINFCKADQLNAHLESVEFVAYEVATIADLSIYNAIAHAADAELDISDGPSDAVWHSRTAALDHFGNLDELVPQDDRA